MTDVKFPGGFDLTGLMVLVIGAQQGIGRSVAETCAAQGARLVLADMEEPSGPARVIESRFETVIVTKACDIADRSAVEALAAELHDAGTAPNAIALTAGVTRYNDWIESPADTWDQDVNQIFDVNMKGPINVARAFLPHMQAVGWGRFVLVGSIAGRMGGVTSQPHYAASKGGVHAMTRLLAAKYARSGVLVNAVAPGPTRTRMTENREINTEAYPLGRLLETEDIAWPITFLLSPACSGMVGAILDVNGGIVFS
ncbi:MAG: short-chain dehydrogenase [Rhodospirillaceae bacterium]|nr:short-chain dehydrogenase [Rhodospirillaceae bacterium]